MAVGEAMREARTKRGLTQDEIGQVGYVTNKMISAIERGTRQAGADVLERMSTFLDYYRLYLEAASSVTGGVYVTPWLDGEGVSLHRTSVWAKSIEELEEARASLKLANIINDPNLTNEEQKKVIHESLIQALDARVAVDHYVGIICEEYGFKLTDIYAEHRRKLESRGYVKPKKKSVR